MIAYVNKTHMRGTDSVRTFTRNHDTFLIGEKKVNNVKYNTFATLKMYKYREGHKILTLFLDSLDKFSMDTTGLNLNDYEEIEI